MPRRELSNAELQLVIRCIMDAQHILNVRNGGTFVEAGVALEDADESTASTIEDTDLIAHLQLALAVLGWTRGAPTPVRTTEQLLAAMGLQLPDFPQ